MSMVKHTPKSIYDDLTQLGYIPQEEIIKANKPILCLNKDGYKVFVYYYQVVYKGQEPCAFSKSNRYTIDNIQVAASKKDSNCVVMSTDNHGSEGDYTFKCRCGKVYNQNLYTFLSTNNYGVCQDCSRVRKCDGKRVSIEKIRSAFEEKGYAIQGDLRSDIGITMMNIPYICSKHIEHGVQYITPGSLMYRHSGCRHCSYEKRGENRRLSDEYLRMITESVGFIYVDSERVNVNGCSRTFIKFICPNHKNLGIQKQAINNMRISNGRCKYCVHKNLPESEFLSLLREVTSKISISEYISSSVKMKATCLQCGNTWRVTGTNLLRGMGCAVCGASNFEKNVDVALSKLFDEIEHQKRFQGCIDKLPLPFDFFIPSINTIVEADGEGHYLPIPFNGISDDQARDALLKTQLHDRIKNDYCIKNGINVIRIPYWEKYNIDDYLIGEFAKIKIQQSA